MIWGAEYFKLTADLRRLPQALISQRGAGMTSPSKTMPDAPPRRRTRIFSLKKAARRAYGAVGLGHGLQESRAGAGIVYMLGKRLAQLFAGAASFGGFLDQDFGDGADMGHQLAGQRL